MPLSPQSNRVVLWGLQFQSASQNEPGGFLFVHYAGGTEELYDERRDPYELHNIAGSPDVAAARAHLLQETRRLCTPPPPGFTF